MSCPVAGASSPSERRRAAARTPAPPMPPITSLRISSMPPKPENRAPPPPASRAAARENRPVPTRRFRNGVPGPNPPPCAKSPGCAPSKPAKRGLPSASISPLSNALRFFSSPRISYAEFSSENRPAAFGSFVLASGCSFLASLRKALLMCARARPPRHPQNLIGVAHSCSNSDLKSTNAGITPTIVTSNVGLNRLLRNVAGDAVYA